MVIEGIVTWVDEGLKWKPTSFFITDALIERFHIGDADLVYIYNSF